MISNGSSFICEHCQKLRTEVHLAIDIKKEEKILLKKIRFRTLGCYPLTGAIESDAETLETIVLELLKSKTSEREGRAIDNDSSSSMEKKKLEGYF